MSHPNPLPIETDVSTVNRMRQDGQSFVLLDVREEDEYQIARIDGSKLIPMSQLDQRVEELASHRDDHIVVHCHHGGRSLRVTQFLRDQGFGKVQNMAGGIDQWSEQIDPQVPRY